MTMAKKPAKIARKSTAKSKPKSARRKAATRKPVARKPARKAAPRKPSGSRKSSANKRPAPKGKIAARPQTKAKPVKPVPAKPALTKADLKAATKPVKVAPLPQKIGKNGKAAPVPMPGAKQAAPAHKPSAGEIAAKIAGKRAEEHKKGKNGRHSDIAPRELTPADVEARKRRLKNLIVLGKERGYLTYAEINDHLPDDILDAEQIEGIISMIGDMGIQVYDEAPDAETLLMSETPATVPAEDVEEEAEAAASTLDSEFGRTTDPVRMYMREMGSVELLTREGEIEIAKRIEEGLKHMILAISACPMTVAQILDLADKIGKDELKIDDVVDGLLDFNEELTAIEEDAEEIDEEEDETDPGAIESENLERLKVAALERFGTIRRLFTRMLAVLQKDGHKAPKYLDLQK